MAIITRTASSNTTPDAGQGGNAVTGNDNNGHGSTTVSQVANGTNTKSCIWENFGADIPGGRKSVTLKFDYSEDGVVIDISNSFRVQVSVDNGSNYSSALQHNNVVAPNSASVSLALNNAADISQIKVRDRLQATSTSDVGGASLTASISNIRIEIDPAEAQLVVMM